MKPGYYHSFYCTDPKLPDIKRALLHIDTSAETCLIMVSAERKCLAYQQINESRAQSSRVNILIDKVMREAGLEWNDLSALSICNGPGSYTGLRVGLATAKGISYASGIPLILHHKLELIAASYREGRPDLAVFLKARDKELYGVLYREGQKVKDPQHLFNVQLPEWLSGRAYHIVTDDLSIKDHSNNLILLPEDTYYIDKDLWVNIAFDVLERKDFADLAYAEPFYLKAAFTTQRKSDILQRKS